MDNLDDFKQYSRKVGKLLPQKAEDIVDNTVEKSKELFYKMRRDTDRQRMAADVDIKVFLNSSNVFVLMTAFPQQQLRGMYYDRIERTEVTALLDSIYQHVELLEDIQFLVKYATQVLPPDPKHANGKVVWDNILALQETLTQQRQVCLL